MSAKQPPNPSRSRVEAARSGSRVPLVAVVAVATLVVVVLVVVILAVRGDDDGEVATGPGAQGDGAASVDQPFGPVSVEGEALDPFSGGGQEDPARGAPAPVLVGETPGGEPITVEVGDGPMVVAFVAHWCPHCQVEVPRIVDLAGGAAEIEGVEFVAVATGTRRGAPNYPPGAWLAEEGWPAPVLLDDEAATAAAAYGVTGYPFLVAVDGTGAVVARSSGELGDDGIRDFFSRVAG